MRFIDFIMLYEAIDPETRRNRKLMLKYFLSLKNYSYWNADHSIEVAKLARDFGKYLNFDTTKILKSAITHDIGKITVAKDVLHKPGKLNDAERQGMNKHAGASSQELSKLTGEHGRIAIIAAKFHHTKPQEIDRKVGDGELTVEEGELVKLVTICDIFEALTSKARPYKKPMTKFDALELMNGLDIVDYDMFKKFEAWQHRDFANEYRQDYVERARAALLNKGAS